MDIAIIKIIHILSATLLFGTGLGSVFYKWQADRCADLRAIYITNRNVVLADWLFTTPTVIVQPLSGYLLMKLNGYALSATWLWLSLLLFVIAGACWLPVVYLQIRMRDIAKCCLDQGIELTADYQRLNKIWIGLGVPAFIAIIAIYVLMVARPV